MRVSALARRSALLAAALGALALTACNKTGGESGASGGSVAVLGPANAPVTVTEYASVTCGACAGWDREVWPAFKAKYVDTGLVRYELREMLTPPNQVAAAGWLLARCAPADRRIGVVQSIYESQQEMAQTQDYRGILQRIGAQAGLNQQQFEECVSNEDALVALNERVEAAVERGVEGTPTFFINGKKHEGNITIEGFDAALQPLVRGKQAAG
ncbi:MAG: DsbA family protein [Proteobacteria bacterium]|nr:DsbA family protein [Pseudomonadota bacterium]